MKFLLTYLTLSLLLIFSTSKASDDEGQPLLQRAYAVMLRGPNDAAVNIQDDEGERSLVERWLTEEVTPTRPQSISKKLLMNGTELYITASRGAVYVMLGYNLAQASFDLEEGIQENMLSVIYGELVAVPMALLGSVTSRQFIDDADTFFEKYFTNRREFERAIEEPFRNRALKFAAKLLLVGSPALISSSTVTYLAEQEFSPVIGNLWWIFGAPNLFVRALMDYEKVPIVFEKIRNYGRIRQFVDGARSCIGISNERKNLEDSVRRNLLESKAYISSLTDERVRDLLDDIRSGDNARQLKALFGGRQEPRIETTGEKWAGSVLAAISFAGLWVYYPLTVDAFESILQSFGTGNDDDNPSISTYSNVLASVALSSASAIFSVAGYDTGKKCWNFFKKSCSGLHKKTESFFSGVRQERREETDLQPYVVGGIATFLAGCTASTAYEIYNDWPIDNEVISALVLTSAITSQFALSAWAVNGALEKHFASKNTREPLISKIDTVIGKLSDMSGEHLRVLNEIMQNSIIHS